MSDFLDTLMKDKTKLIYLVGCIAIIIIIIAIIKSVHQKENFDYSQTGLTGLRPYESSTLI